MEPSRVDGLPTSVNLIKIVTHRHTQTFQVILDLTKFTIDNSYHNNQIEDSNKHIMNLIQNLDMKIMKSIQDIQES